MPDSLPFLRGSSIGSPPPPPRLPPCFTVVKLFNARRSPGRYFAVIVVLFYKSTYLFFGNLRGPSLPPREEALVQVRDILPIASNITGRHSGCRRMETSCEVGGEAMHACVFVVRTSSSSSSSRCWHGRLVGLNVHTRA